MNIDQPSPNGPNFLLIVILFCVAILIIFGLAWLFLHMGAAHLGMRHHTAAPLRHSRLILPIPPTTPTLT